MAIRQNSESIYGMKKQLQQFYNDETARHRFCPGSVHSWCKWQVDQITGANTYKSKINLPIYIQKLLWSSDPTKLTIFRELSVNILKNRLDDTWKDLPIKFDQKGKTTNDS